MRRRDHPEQKITEHDGRTKDRTFVLNSSVDNDGLVTGGGGSEIGAGDGGRLSQGADRSARGKRENSPGEVSGVFATGTNSSGPLTRTDDASRGPRRGPTDRCGVRSFDSGRASTVRIFYSRGARSRVTRVPRRTRGARAPPEGQSELAGPPRPPRTMTPSANTSFRHLCPADVVLGSLHLRSS